MHGFVNILVRIIVVTCLLMAGGAMAQPYPNHALRLLVGGAAGSVPDVMIRPIAARLSEVLGQPVVVENRPGAAGSIAMQALIGSPADGYTLALATMSQAVFNSYLFSKLPYDPLRELEPLTPLATGAMVLAVHPSFPARTLQEFVAIAKEQPGKVLVAMPQSGSPPHVVGLLLNRATKIDVTMVPHKSGAEALNAVLGGQIPALIDAPTIIASHVAAGRLRALVVTGQQREAVLPDVRTANESGLPDMEGEAWLGLVAPVGTPREIVLRLNRELVRIMAMPDIQVQMARFSFRSRTSTPEAFRTLIEAEHRKWSAVIRDAGLHLD